MRQLVDDEAINRTVRAWIERKGRKELRVKY